MKNTILFGCSLLAIVALVSIGREPSTVGQAGAGKPTGEQLITVLNPAATHGGKSCRLCGDGGSEAGIFPAHPGDGHAGALFRQLYDFHGEHDHRERTHPQATGMDPTVALLLKNAHGFKTKAELSEWLSKNAEVAAGTYWGNRVNATANTAFAFQGLEPYATWKKVAPETLIKPFINPKAIHVVVAGGKTQTTWFVTDFRFGKGILIDEWK
jgi:hypothetical protein